MLVIRLFCSLTKSINDIFWKHLNKIRSFIGCALLAIVSVANCREPLPADGAGIDGTTVGDEWNGAGGGRQWHAGCIRRDIFPDELRDGRMEATEEGPSAATGRARRLMTFPYKYTYIYTPIHAGNGRLFPRCLSHFCFVWVDQRNLSKARWSCTLCYTCKYFRLAVGRSFARLYQFRTICMKLYDVVVAVFCRAVPFIPFYC